MEIIKEELTGCINRMAVGAPKFRFWVIETPISETGICIEFNSEEEASQFMRIQAETNRSEHAEVSHMVLTYDSEPTSKGEAQDHIEWMLKALGIQKAIALTEINQTRHIHHQVILSKEDAIVLKKWWTVGSKKCIEHTAPCGSLDLLEYIAKYQR